MKFCTEAHRMDAFPTVKVYGAGPKTHLINDAVVLQCAPWHSHPSFSLPQETFPCG